MKNGVSLNENEHWQKMKGFFGLLHLGLFVSAVFCFFSGEGFKRRLTRLFKHTQHIILFVQVVLFAPATK